MRCRINPLSSCENGTCLPAQAQDYFWHDAIIPAKKTLKQQTISITLSVNSLMRPDHYRHFDRQGSITGKMAAGTGETGACP
ncbi:hypothetical protein Gxy13693_018_057 [Komagataeibacter xylinus NBRC 13693]|uniref:Uncharacterized protein n=1 Tax=Komagataeibacter xylinus NBRC 13693 TaxID=1234668 RepID=A0A0D6Q6T3_KOMXY|nr:hypothetical protein Gxy13693_018_057 [Komagataeibacter xylinus NBRC 13693]